MRKRHNPKYAGTVGVKDKAPSFSIDNKKTGDTLREQGILHKDWMSRSKGTSVGRKRSWKKARHPMFMEKEEV